MKKTSRPLYLIALDGVGREPLGKWIREGKLPSLKKVIDQNQVKVRTLHNDTLMRTESCWLTFYQGNSREACEEIAHCDYNPKTYDYRENTHYILKDSEPFFRNSNHPTVIFDTPLIQAEVSGMNSQQTIEIFGWGCETNVSTASSKPKDKMSQIINKFGLHPIYAPPKPTSQLTKDPHGAITIELPNIYNRPMLLNFLSGLKKGVTTRTQIIDNLLSQYHPNFAIFTYAEAHSAGHLAWHASNPHPLGNNYSSDILLPIFQCIDQGLGKLFTNYPNADFALFSPQGMQSNFIELSSSLFLPEMLFRYARDNAQGLIGGDRKKCESLNPSEFSHWKYAIEKLINSNLINLIETPTQLTDVHDCLAWSPARWYKKQWPTMNAFALPSFSEGLIRLNIKGRDGSGHEENQISREGYPKYCEKLCEFLQGWRCAISGKKLIRNIIQTCDNELKPHANYKAFAADLIVQWREPVITNHIIHPKYGEIGPVPYFRTGAHSEHGMLIDLTKYKWISNSYQGKMHLTDLVTELRGFLNNS